MRTTVFTNRYEFAHGKAPRGSGSWAFHPNFNVDCASKEIFWINAKWGEAKKAAIAHFSALNIPAIYVLS